MYLFRRIGLAGARLWLPLLVAAAALAIAAGLAHAEPAVADLAPHFVTLSGHPQEADSPPIHTPQIVGGQPAPVGDHPWQLRLVLGDRICGAVLVHEEWALTAAHCLLEPDGSPAAVQKVALVAADHSVDEVDSTQQLRTAATVVFHPAFDPATRAYDVALVRLHHLYLPSPDVGPIALATLPADVALLEPGRPALATGWGAGVSSPALHLRRAAMRLVDGAVCAAAYPGLSSAMLCAEPAPLADGGDVCAEDDGGPLAVPTGAGGFKLAGVAGVRGACGQASQPSVFTAAPALASWVNATVSAASRPQDGPANAVRNPGFEAGPDGVWTGHSTRFGLSGSMIRPSSARAPARTGAHMAWLGGAEGDTATLTQTVTIPDAGGVLHYHLLVRSAEAVCGDDMAAVGVDDVTLATHELCDEWNLLGWTHNRATLPASLAGQSVTLWVRVVNDDKRDSYTNVILDDVRIAASEAGTAALWLSIGRLDFGGAPLGEEKTLSLTLQASGELPVSIAGLSATGDFAVAGHDCPVGGGELEAAARCTVSIRFAPAAGGERSGALAVETSAGSYSVELAGSGVAAGLPTPWTGETDQGRPVAFRLYPDAQGLRLWSGFSLSACLDGAGCQVERRVELAGPLDVRGGTFYAAGEEYAISGRLLEAGGAEGTYAFWSWSVTADGPPARFGRWSAAPLPEQRLEVTLDGAGGGAVTSRPAAIRCGSRCSAAFPHGTSVTLEAAPAAGSLFTGWEGACISAESSCVVRMDRTRTVTARFEPAVPLEVEVVVPGGGQVVSDPPGILCGQNCAALYPVDTQVTLTAVPAQGFRFARWSGACSGQDADCLVELDEAAAAVAEFTADRSTIYLPSVQR